MKKPKNQVLDVGDHPDQNKNDHIDIPVEPECQQDVCVVEGSGLDL